MGSRSTHRRRVVVSIAALLIASLAPSARAASCESLAALTLPEATITFATTIAPGAFTPPVGGRGRGPTAYGELPAFCRIAATLTPSSDSDIKIEVWMPMTGWNGKLDVLGGQGWAGAIGYAGLRDALRRGYATASTDTGHTGGSGSFALEHPERLVDFASRAQHEMAVKAKLIVAAFYGHAATSSYFDGCSTGGRMALTEAQRFPDDFNGIIAGAAANFSSHQAAQMLAVARAMHDDDASYIPPVKYSLLHDAVLSACDALDGVKDGVIENPARCHFDPAVLECKGDETPACLTPKQVAAARKVYAPLLNPRTRQVIFPGLAPGSELGWGLSAGPQPQSFPNEIYQDIVFKDAHWDYKTLDFDRDITRAEQAAGGIMDAVDPNLRAFFARGGKLLQYHGWSDQAVAPENSINYYTSVRRVVGAKQVEQSYRLFMVPGMGHCGGGDGASTFDMLTSLDAWVERAQPPDRILASRVRNGGADRTRPLCRYPQIAVYSGAGSTDDAANFVCKAP
jgi:tannase/feruloyl esterase